QRVGISCSNRMALPDADPDLGSKDGSRRMYRLHGWPVLKMVAALLTWKRSVPNPNVNELSWIVPAKTNPWLRRGTTERINLPFPGKKNHTSAPLKCTPLLWEETSVPFT